MLAEYREAFTAFSGNARLYLLGQTLLWIGTNQFALLLSLYLKSVGYSENTIGGVLATKALGSALVALPASFIAARFNLKKLLPLAAVFVALANLAQGIADSGNVVLAAAFLAGSFSTVFQVSSGPFFMRNSGEGERMHLFSLNGALSMGTGVVGSLLGGGVKDLAVALGADEILAYRIGLSIGAAFMLSALLPFARLKDGTAPEIRRVPVKGDSRSDAIGAGLWIKLILPGFLIGLGAGLTIPYLNLYFKDVFRLGDGAIGVAVAAGQVATFLGMASGPLFARRLGKPLTILITQSISVPLILVLAWIHWLPLAIIAYMARQALMNLATPIQDMFALELVPPSRMITVNAVKMLAWAGSWTISARLSGYLIWQGGFAPSFTITAILYTLGTLLFWIFFIRGKTQRAPLAPAQRGQGSGKGIEG
jgi:MFS family permease